MPASDPEYFTDEAEFKPETVTSSYHPATCHPSNEPIIIADSDDEEQEEALSELTDNQTALYEDSGLGEDSSLCNVNNVMGSRKK